MSARNTIDGILSRVAKREDGCHEWTGAKIGSGYGNVRWNGRPVLVHRLMYEHFVGPIPDGLVIDHLCRNRACCNPEHLEVVTFSENILRGTGCTAVNAKKTSCPSGHPLSGDNLYVRPSDGGRICKACVRGHQRKRYWKNRSPVQ